MENIDFSLPESRKGRKSPERQKKYDSDLKAFADALIKLDKTLEDKVSSRGWAYLMEDFRLINKSQFDYAQKLINHCRKTGLLPIDFVAVDKNRSFSFVEKLEVETESPKVFINKWLNALVKSPEWKDDIVFWESQEYFIQMVVEKIDVKTVFSKICKEYHIPISNGKGWADINSRNDLAQRYIQAKDMGLKCVLLYYGDFDPVGLQIGEVYRKNLKDLELGTHFDPSELIIDHFGLSFEFIEDNNLTWINNLESGSGKKPDKSKDVIKNYIAKYGERKVEANIIVIPEIREKVEIQLTNIIHKYLGENPFEKYDKKIEVMQDEVKEIMNQLKIEKIVNDIKNELDILIP